MFIGYFTFTKIIMGKSKLDRCPALPSESDFLDQMKKELAVRAEHENPPHRAAIVTSPTAAELQQIVKLADSIAKEFEGESSLLTHADLVSEAILRILENVHEASSQTEGVVNQVHDKKSKLYFNPMTSRIRKSMVAILLKEKKNYRNKIISKLITTHEKAESALDRLMQELGRDLTRYEQEEQLRETLPATTRDSFVEDFLADPIVFSDWQEDREALYDDTWSDDFDFP